MAGEFGQAGALAYNIPQRFGLSQQQAAVQQASAQPQVQQLDPLTIGHQLLAEREQLTDDYYNNYGILDAYVKDMAKKGVDPFMPDYTQPGGGEVFKTLQRLKANYYHGANALAVEREAEKARAQDIADNKIQQKQGIDTQGFYATDPNNFQNLQVDPMIVEKNKYLGDQFLNEAEVAKAKETNYDPIYNQLKQQRAAIIANGGKEGIDTFEVDRAMQALVNPNRVNPALRVAGISAAARAAAGKKNSYDLNVMKDWYNAFAGNWKIDPTKPAPTRTDSVYGKVSVYNDKNGKRLGSWTDPKGIEHARIIKDMIKTPDHRVIVSYTDPRIPKDDVTDPQDLVKP